MGPMARQIHALAIATLTVAVAACSGSGAGSTGPDATAAAGSGTSPTPTAAASQAAASQLAGPSVAMDVTGDGGLSGHLTLDASRGSSLRCALPTFGGPEIEAFLPSSVPGIALHVIVSATADAATVAVTAATTTTPPATRTFRGTGVTGFDPARGATIDSTLVEQASGNPGSIGALRSIKATIDCGAPASAISTLQISGSGLPNLDGPISPASVQCVGAGPAVSVIGMSGPASSPAFRIVVGITPTQLVVAIQSADQTPPTIYTSVTATSMTGGSVSVDANLATTATSGSASAATGHVHLGGAVSCGTAG